MPIPAPRPTEDEDTFIARCLRDQTLNDAYPEQEQRAALCVRQWREAAGDSAADGTTVHCWTNHLGIWCIEPLWFQGMIAEYRAGRLQPHATELLATGPVSTAGVDPDRRRYDVENHVAIVPLMGPITKGVSKFGGASTVETRRALRHAARNDEVHGIVLHVDSPGGHVAGIQELADDVHRIAQQKPTTAHIDDLGASAAYWVAAQTGRITANATAEVGSIGTMAVLEDTSKRLERLGITVHVIATGPYKGIGVEGAPVSPAALDDLQRRVHAINQHFVRAVQRGRRLTPEQMTLLTDGKVHGASTARHLSLIDAVQSLEATIEEMTRRGRGVPGMARPAGARGEGPRRSLAYYKLAVSR